MYKKRMSIETEIKSIQNELDNTLKGNAQYELMWVLDIPRHYVIESKSALGMNFDSNLII
jgi:hypothetical protein